MRKGAFPGGCTVRTNASEMRRVLLISNVFGPCRYWMSEQRRAEGFRRYLSEFGWDCRLLVKGCNCARGEGEPPSESAICMPHSVPATPQAVGGFFADKREQLNERVHTIRLKCAPRGAYAAWLRLARSAGYRFASPEDEQEICHLVFPFPGFNDPPAGKGRGARGFLLFVVKALGLLVGRVHEQDRVDWVRRGACVGAELVKGLGIDVVIGSFPARQNLAVAERVAARTGIPWIADFRDSATGGWCCSAKEVPLVTRCLRTAKAVIHTSEGYAAQDRELFAEAAHIIENGFMAEDLDAARRASDGARERDGFVIRFLGALYPWRNLDMFFEGLRELAASTPDVAEKLRFEYYGQSREEAATAAEQYGVAGLVSAHGPVPGCRALELTVSAMVLVLPTNTVGHTGVPGAKFYEYLGARRPILAIGGRDAYVADVLARTGSGVLCSSAREVADTVALWYADRSESGCLNMPFVDEEIGRYSRREGARKLAGVLDAVVGQRTSAVTPV